MTEIILAENQLLKERCEKYEQTIEDIKAEIRMLYSKYGDGSGWAESRNITLNDVLKIIDRHISEMDLPEKQMVEPQESEVNNDD